MIFYFTGTGNSRFVAQMLASELNDSAVSMNDYIKEHRTGCFESAERFVFVSPVYVSAPAKAFENFILSCSFIGTKKAWFVCTCAGGFGASPAYCEALSADKGFDYMGTSQVVMPQNYIALFKTNPPEVCAQIIEDAKPHIRELADFIRRGEAFPDPGAKRWEKISTRLILDLYYKCFMGTKAFTAGDACISCGKCVKGCVLNNIELISGRPVWGKNCTHCMACINLCPTGAIEYGGKTAGKPRYRCPEYR